MPAFRCPVCQAELSPPTEPKAPYRCGQNHCFDPAKAGYLNLLLSQHKKSKQPGDSPEMVKARQDFLEKGYYAPMAHRVAQLLHALTSSVGTAAKARTLLDMGCGEGYYLAQVQAATPAGEPPLHLSGIDVSKTAVSLAARRQPGGQWAVASVYQLPFFDQVFDLALSVFSPLSPEETARVVRPGGHLLTVGPGSEHLRGLMAEVYTQVQPHQGNPVLQQAMDQRLWEPVATHEVSLALEVLGSDIFNLLTMTPYYWKCNPETQARFRAMKRLQTPAHFEIQIYRRHGLV